MNLISCNYNCKYQQDGYCNLNYTAGGRHQGSKNCVYFDPPDDSDIRQSTLSDDSELL